MSKVALIIENLGDEKASLIAEIRSMAPVTISEILSAVKSQRPVFEKTLLDRHDEEFTGKLVHLLRRLERSNIPHVAYRIPDQETFDPSMSSKYFRLSSVFVSNKIKGEAEQDREDAKLDRLGHAW